MPHYTVDQLLENCRMMDMNKDSLVDLNEFLEAFRLCQNFQTRATMIATDLTSDPDTTKNESSIKQEKAKEKSKSKETEPEPTSPILNVEQDVLDQYEIQETFESANNGGGIMRRSSIISIESFSNSNLTQSDAPLITNNKNHSEQSNRNSKENHLDDSGN